MERFRTCQLEILFVAITQRLDSKIQNFTVFGINEINNDEIEHLSLDDSDNNDNLITVSRLHCMWKERDGGQQGEPETERGREGHKVKKEEGACPGRSQRGRKPAAAGPTVPKPRMEAAPNGRKRESKAGVMGGRENAVEKGRGKKKKEMRPEAKHMVPILDAASHNNLLTISPVMTTERYQDNNTDLRRCIYIARYPAIELTCKNIVERAISLRQCRTVRRVGPCVQYTSETACESKSAQRGRKSQLESALVARPEMMHSEVETERKAKEITKIQKACREYENPIRKAMMMLDVPRE
uniref:Uncharacterized protein n=1 Tax=Parascaris univalens TaxID=6257 RepID=A0A915CK68_PARUN